MNKKYIIWSFIFIMVGVIVFWFYGTLTNNRFTFKDVEVGEEIGSFVVKEINQATPVFEKSESNLEVIFEGEVTVRWMSEEEKTGEIEVREDELIKPTRVRMKKEDFFESGFTQGCPGCQAIINNGRAKSHNEACRKSGKRNGQERRR
jgi:hypothetical protein